MINYLFFKKYSRNIVDKITLHNFKFHEKYVDTARNALNAALRGTNDLALHEGFVNERAELYLLTDESDSRRTMVLAHKTGINSSTEKFLFDIYKEMRK